MSMVVTGTMANDRFHRCHGRCRRGFPVLFPTSVPIAAWLIAALGAACMATSRVATVLCGRVAMAMTMVVSSDLCLCRCFVPWSQSRSEVVLCLHSLPPAQPAWWAEQVDLDVQPPHSSFCSSFFVSVAATAGAAMGWRLRAPSTPRPAPQYRAMIAWRIRNSSCSLLLRLPGLQASRRVPLSW